MAPPVRQRRPNSIIDSMSLAAQVACVTIAAAVVQVGWADSTGFAVPATSAAGASQPPCAIQFLVLTAAFKNDDWTQCAIYNDTSVILVAGLRDLGFTAVGRCCLVDDAGPAGHGDCLNGPRRDAEFDSSQVVLLNAQSANAAWDMQNFFDTAAVPARDAPWPPDIVANGWLPATASTLPRVKLLSVALSPW